MSETTTAPETPVAKRRSKLPYIFMLFAGMLIGRIASEQFASGLLSAIDLVMYVALAFSVAWAWRTWARRAMERRALQAQRRAPRSGHRGRSGTSGTSSAASSEPEPRSGDTPPPRRRRRRPRR